MSTEHYRELLRGVFAGKRCIVAVDVLAGATSLVAELQQLGATAVMCIAGTRGTGPVPDPEQIPSVLLGLQGDDLMAVLHATDAALSELPADVVAQVDAFDPRGEALAIGTLFSSGRPVAGRRMFGARSPAQQGLEDKTTVDAMWDALAIPRAPSAIVEASPAALIAAAAKFDLGLGSVWAADNKAGWHGAGYGTRWVRDDVAAAAEEMASRCDSVRVMPFLEGIPCSIHGFVFADTCIALRPCEMVVLRCGHKLVYARCATFWDPPAADRDSMRELALNTGKHLRAAIGYRGAFTIDGIMTVDGFRPTELNPRYGAGLGVMATALDGLPLFLLNLAILDGVALDYRPAALEALIVQSADAHRVGGGGLVVSKPIAETTKADWVCEASRWRVAAEGETSDAAMTLGPSPAGGYLRLEMPAERTPIGPSVAPRVAAALQAVGAHYGLGIGELTAATDVRPGQ